MPKKSAEKKVKKVMRTAKTPVKPPVEASTESTIESLPSPTVEPQSPATVETIQPISASEVPTSSVVPTPTTSTPVPTTPQTTAAPTSTPTIVTEPDPMTSVTADSLTAATIPTITMPPTDEVSATDDFEPEHKGNLMKIILIFLTALIVGGGAVAGFLYFSPEKPTTEKKILVSPTQAPSIPTQESVASESAEPSDVAKLSVQILNGSGTPGEAARVRDQLQAAGFETFSLGNADSYDYTDTEVQLKEASGSGTFEKIKKALTSYTVVGKDTLPASSDYDVVINVGKQK